MERKTIFLIVIFCNTHLISIFGIHLGRNNEIPGTDIKTNGEKDLYLIKIKSIDCYNVDPRAFTNGTCKLRAVRGHQGVIDLFYVYHNIPRLSTSYKLYYRNGNGRYMNYFIDITVNYCKIHTQNLGLQQLAMKILLNFYNKYDNAILNGCPCM